MEQESAQSIAMGESAEFTVSVETPISINIRLFLDVESQSSPGADYEIDCQLLGDDQWEPLGQDPSQLIIDLPSRSEGALIRVTSRHTGVSDRDIPLRVGIDERSFVRGSVLDIESQGEASILLTGSSGQGNQQQGHVNRESVGASKDDKASDSAEGGGIAADGGSDDTGEEASADSEVHYFLTYSVKPGDTLEAIAQASYGDAAQWQRIFDANRGRRQNDGYMFTSSDSIRYGWVLNIPNPISVPRASAVVGARYVSYVVQPGDSLGAISQKAYGDAGYWTRIEAANMGRRQVGGGLFTNSDRIEAGWVLRIPLAG